MTKQQKQDAIERFARANASDPFAAARAESRINNKLFDTKDGVIHIWE